MKPTRRGFLQTIAGVIGTTAVGLPVFAATRPSFVEEGEIVISLIFHMWDRPRAPTGPIWVHKILDWDGTGYPLILKTHDWPPGGWQYYDGWYDFEWSNFRRDVPARFWAFHSTDRYPNVHSYVREKRFGEHPSVMRRIMDNNTLFGPPENRLVAKPIQWSDV